MPLSLAVVCPGKLWVGVYPYETMRVKIREPVEKLISVAGERCVGIHNYALPQHGSLMDQLVEQDPYLEFVFVDLLIAVVDLIARVDINVAKAVFLCESFGKIRLARPDVSAHQIHFSHAETPLLPNIVRKDLTAESVP